MFNWLKTLVHKDDAQAVFLGDSKELWLGTDEATQPVFWRKGKSLLADALAATGTKSGEYYSIDKHYADGNGVWHPVVLDPLGESSQEFVDQWFAAQKAEKRLLAVLGESLSY